MAYDMHEILLRIFDDGDFLEVAAQAGPAIITGVRPRRRPPGRRHRQPADVHRRVRSTTRRPTRPPASSGSATRSTSPLVFVVDTPGFMPGVEQEKGGIIKRGGRFLYAVVEADVPKVTITVRKSYGGAYAVMGSKQLTADLNFAWPTARIAVIGAEGAAQLLVKRFPDPTAPEVQKIKADFIEGYNLNLAIPWIAAERGYIDARHRAAPDPAAAAQVAMHLLRDKQIQRVQRKHGLIPI